MRFMRAGALLCACAMWVSQTAAVAEENRLGDYIYVPAMSVPGNTGTISLRVEALAISPQGAPQEVEALAGAEFGVYVYSSEGVLTPWANPLLPSEPMRIRTGEGETRFTLPQGMEFYLRQESAPQGYLFDRDALIPVTGDEIVVRNEMAGQLVIRVQDRLGSPMAGVALTVTGESGVATQLVTDESGQAVFFSETAQTVTIREDASAAGVAAPIGVQIVNPAEKGGEVPSVSDPIAEDTAYACAVGMRVATRTEVTFEHPAHGSVQLEAVLSVLNEHGQTVEQPLAGVSMDILADTPVRLTTDENGRADLLLVEGTYDVRFSYEGEEGAVLPLSQGQVIVQGDETTFIELTATQRTGRVAVQATCEGESVAGGYVTLIREETGELFGPYELDAEGLAVSDALEPGNYRAVLEAPQGMQMAALSCGDTTTEEEQGLVIAVLPGELTRVDAHLLQLRSQRFELIIREISETGDVVETRLEKPLLLELAEEGGQVLGRVEARDGYARVEAVKGNYVLRMTQSDADELGVMPQSETFTLPAEGEALAFDAAMTRMVIASVDENGKPVSGAVYTVEEGTRTHTVTTNEEGVAVTPLLWPGEVTVTTQTAPSGYDISTPITITARQGEAVRAEIRHESYGTAHFEVRMQDLDEYGHAVLSPLEGIGIRLFSVGDGGQQMADTGIVLTSDADGLASVQLAPGEYVAQVQEDGLPQGCRSQQALRFTVQNMQQSGGEMICLGALGGVRARLIGGELSDEELAQVRFELLSSDGQSVGLTMQEGAFYVGDLPSGTYVLRQTQIPQGYTLASERTVSVSGGEVVNVDVPLEEYAVLTVSKTGLTFDDSLRTYVVPLTGEYGIYTMEDGELRPYPSADSQMTVWSNVAQDDPQRKSSVKLPASVEGTSYYLLEKSDAPGFTKDTQAHEVTLFAGVAQTLECGVSSDRGFFSLDVTDATTGEHVSGGEFELVDASGETVLSFTMGDQAYQNEMAVPVGAYTLRQTAAPQGYALCSQPEIALHVTPYLAQGGSMTAVSMECLSLPETAEIDEIIADMYAASEQGLTLVSVDGGALRMGETLITPQLTVRVEDANGGRVNVASLVLASATDAEGGQYRARVEYCLAGGGWQPSDARMTGVLDAPTALSLTDVEDDICAVRVTYLNVQTGEERAGSAFTPGQLTLNVQISADKTQEVEMLAEAGFTGTFEYRTEPSAKVQHMQRTAQRSIAFTARGNGRFETVSAGRDGCISGVAFFDEDADGVMDESESGRYAGLTVSLVAQSGEVVASTRTGADGRYGFDSISSGVYTVQFDGGEAVVFSSNDTYSEHMTSGVADLHYGMSAMMAIDGDHTDYVVNVGCIYAAGLHGSVRELLADGQQSGVGGLSVEMRPIGFAEGEEPAVVVTNDLGEFGFTGVLPGTYEVRLVLPEGYLCDEAENGTLIRVMQLEQGDTFSMGEILVRRAASVSGRVRVDDDGDGILDAGAQPLSGVRVILLSTEDGHTGTAAETLSGADGSYRFDGLEAGRYSVLFELSGEWTFTRYGEDSDVYGAVSQSGGTHPFDLAIGEEIEGIDAGVTLPAQLSVTVFEDAYADGQMGPSESGLGGVAISLIRLENGEDAEEVMYRTDAEGSVMFAGVSPGQYVIAYQMPGQWRATGRDPQAGEAAYPVSCVEASTLSAGRSEPFTLSMGQSGVRLYIGAALSGSISGMVYEDADADAQLGEQEALYAGMTVELLDAQGQVQMKTSSAEDGSYAFEGLASGRYSVRFTAPQDCGFSESGRKLAGTGILQEDTHVYQTRMLTVTGGEAISSVDAGVVRLGSVSGMLWVDSNADAVRGGEEQSLAGVPVHLMNSAGRTILATVTTDEKGAFTFERLAPGSYLLRVDAPESYVFSGASASRPIPLESERDGRGYTAVFTLLGGAHVQDAAFGLLTQGSIEGRIWNDADYNGMEDEQEEGLRGVQVELLDAEGTPIQSMTTPRSGEFRFESLMPGAYSLRVTLSSGYVFTVGGADSLVPRSDGTDAVLNLGELAMGSAIEGVTIGALEPASVGGTVWYDADNDGRRQSGDRGVATSVTLHVLSGADAGMIYETTADETGAYCFEGIMPGNVQLAFELEEGYAFSKQISGSKRVSCVPQTDALMARTDAFDVSSGENLLDMDAGVVGVGVLEGVIWEDSTYDGLYGEQERGVPGVVVTLRDATGALRTATTDDSGAYAFDFVRTGEYTLEVSLPEGMMFTRDGVYIEQTDERQAAMEPFALAMGESRTGLDVGAILPAALTGRIALDADGDGACTAQDEGLSGVVVTLMQGGTVIATTSTQQDGTYVLDALRPGAYRVRIALPQDALFALGAPLDLAGADAQEGQTEEYVLAMGQQRTLETLPAVKAGTVTGRAWADADADGWMDAEEAALTGTHVELLDAQGDVISAMDVGEDGAYAFGLLREGTYAVRFTLPEGELFADRVEGDRGSCVTPVEGGIAVTEPFFLPMGEQRTLHVGGMEPGEIGDTVWLDTNGNGLQDYREPLVPGVTITLLRQTEDGQLLQADQTLSDGYGYYHFRDLRPGTYVIQVQLQPGDTLTDRWGEPLGEIDSDIDPETGFSDAIRLSSGQTIRNLDIGLTEHAP